MPEKSREESLSPSSFHVLGLRCGEIKSFSIQSGKAWGVDAMGVDYVYPQENGHREDVRWFGVGDGKRTLLCTMRNPLGLNLSNYTDEALE